MSIIQRYVKKQGQVEHYRELHRQQLSLFGNDQEGSDTPGLGPE